MSICILLNSARFGCRVQQTGKRGYIEPSVKYYISNEESVYYITCSNPIKEEPMMFFCHYCSFTCKTCIILSTAAWFYCLFRSWNAGCLSQCNQVIYYQRSLISDLMTLNIYCRVGLDHKPYYQPIINYIYMIYIEKECRPLPSSSFPPIFWFPPYVLVLHSRYLPY